MLTLDMVHVTSYNCPCATDNQVCEHAENVMFRYLAFLLSLPRTSLLFFFF